MVAYPYTVTKPGRKDANVKKAGYRGTHFKKKEEKRNMRTRVHQTSLDTAIGICLVIRRRRAYPPLGLALSWCMSANPGGLRSRRCRRGRAGQDVVVVVIVDIVTCVRLGGTVLPLGRLVAIVGLRLISLSVRLTIRRIVLLLMLVLLFLVHVEGVAHCTSSNTSAVHLALNHSWGTRVKGMVDSIINFGLRLVVNHDGRTPEVRGVEVVTALSAAVAAADPFHDEHDHKGDTCQTDNTANDTAHNTPGADTTAGFARLSSIRDGRLFAPSEYGLGWDIVRRRLESRIHSRTGRSWGRLDVLSSGSRWSGVVGVSRG